MTKWIIAYKNESGKWIIYAKTNYRSQIPSKLEKLFEFNKNIKVIQIQQITE
jgi:hypothetical protein